MTNTMSAEQHVHVVFSLIAFIVGSCFIYVIYIYLCIFVSDTLSI
jgi:hypothetical protein